MVHIEVLSTDELGDRSYVAHDGHSAIVVDPQRDIDRAEAIIERLGLSVELVVETHIHNDYVTGGVVLAARTGARYAVSAEDEVSFERVAVRDGDTLEAGTMTVTVYSTPGHTDHHLSYTVTDGDGPPALFSGGSLLYGSVGRTDLVDPGRTDELTHEQYHSARRLASELPGDTALYPTHGFGSFCSSGSATGGDSSTVELERSRNDALTNDDENDFVATLIANLTAYPAYYAHMAPLNRQGPGPMDLSSPEPVDGEELAKRVADGEWVVDLRERVAYAHDHVAGTVSIELGQQFATYLGWLYPFGSALTLIGETEDDVRAAQRQLARIGVDHLSGAAIASPEQLAASDDRREYRVATFAELPAAEDPDSVVLDVRRDDERAQGGIPGSLHIPMHTLLRRMDEVPDTTVWVHCASGFRASIAASLLDRAGRDVVYVNDNYSAAVDSGLATG